MVKTARGVRLVQHGAVLSEILSDPGPTHSVVDVLAATVAVLCPSEGRIGLLGFAAGGMMAPLRALQLRQPVDAVDLSDEGFKLFRQHSHDWAGEISLNVQDAVKWLRTTNVTYNVLIDDLSMPKDGDVIKPEVAWNELPALMKTRLHPEGVAVFNLLPPPPKNWDHALQLVIGGFRAAQIVMFDEFENRIVIAARDLPPVRTLSSQLREALGRIGSHQSQRIGLRHLKGER